MNDLPAILGVTQIGVDTYSSNPFLPRARTIDGGQMSGQALTAAFETIKPEFQAHSIHASFIAAGDAAMPVTYSVSRDRDGRSFATRHITAIQNEVLIFRMTASFHIPEDGDDIQLLSLPIMPAPSACVKSHSSLVGFDIRDPFPVQIPGKVTSAWAQPTTKLGTDPRLNASALIYLSDMFNGLPDLLDFDVTSFQTSLDHALWIHRPLVLDEWLFFAHHGQSLASGRSLFTGDYFSASGTHVASTAQEMLFRPPRTKS